MITLKKFDSLSKRDFNNGAVQDEIRKAIKDAEKWHAFEAWYKSWPNDKRGLMDFYKDINKDALTEGKEGK